MAFLFFSFIKTSSGDPIVIALFAAVGSVGGLYLFYRGFRMLQFKRLILNTPLSRIHSASIGLVEVTGTPVGPYVLSAPITGDACYYYRVQAWQLKKKEGKDSEWKRVLDETLHVPFFLEDSTGRVLVDAEGAELDVHRSFSDEVSASFFRTPSILPPNVLKFLATRGLVPEEKLKLEERIIPQGFPLFIFGTLGENPAVNSWLPKPHTGSSGSLSFGSPGGVGVNLSIRASTRTDLPVRGAASVASVLRRIPGVQVETTQTQVFRSGTATMVVQEPDSSGPSGTAALAIGISNSPKPSSDKSAFGDFDLHSSVAISKGERNEPFAISDHSQKEVVGKLAWKSAACIWGGPVLAIASFYFLLSYFDLIH